MNFEVSKPVGALRQEAKYTMKTTNKSVLSIGLTALLTACGGGGGGDAAPAAPAAQTPQAATTVAGTTAAMYAVGGEEANAFNLLNKARIECGFGALTQNLSLDRAAAAHASFLITNGLNYGHTEVDALPGFTGQTPQSRAQTQGYSLPVDEDLSTRSGAAGLPGQLRTTREVSALLAAPYHSMSLLNNFADAGIGFSQVQTAAAPGIAATEKIALVFNLGLRSGLNDLAADTVYTYPCAGTTGASTNLPNESPSPIPSTLTQDYRLFGAPITVKVRAGQVLNLTTAAITPAAGGAAIQNQIVTISNDPQSGALMKASDSFVLPLKPLQPGTTYQVNLTGTNSGTPFSKSFSYSTGQ